MAVCCDENPALQRSNCPGCTRGGAGVAFKTIIHQLKSPVNFAVVEQRYFFCASHDCDVVYFNASGDFFEKEHLRNEVGQKSSAEHRLVCYCFDLTYAQILQEYLASGRSGSKHQVITWTQQKLCQCDTQNPSGRCCLADFKQIERWLEEGNS